jgi:hypothetical protein
LSTQTKKAAVRPPFPDREMMSGKQRSNHN